MNGERRWAVVRIACSNLMDPAALSRSTVATSCRKRERPSLSTELKSRASSESSIDFTALSGPPESSEPTATSPPLPRLARCVAGGDGDDDHDDQPHSRRLGFANEAHFCDRRSHFSYYTRHTTILSTVSVSVDDNGHQFSIFDFCSLRFWAGERIQLVCDQFCLGQILGFCRLIK